MGAAGGSAGVAGRAAHPGAAGVVSRPGLFDQLRDAARVTVLCAPAGSGKSFLLRSWISEDGLTESTGWVPVGRDERDPQRFWMGVLGALRQTAPGAQVVGELTAAPDLDGWAIAERLLKDMMRLEEPVWLVIDDVHELGSDDAWRQLELLVMRGPPDVRFVLVTRHDLQMGLHRLRLEGELTEIRAPDLRFTTDEARRLLTAAGADLPEAAFAMLYERTEGWAAGLRLAALSLVGHPDPERFAAEFSGSERTVAEYLLAEVLERQPDEVRRLLLRTSVLDRVSGALADVVTGGSGSEAMLQELEEANAFVVSLDAGRSWFRYHHLFADLLQRELRHTSPDSVTALHQAAAGWLAAHGYPVDAIRHAQKAQDWTTAGRLLADNWPGLHLGGRAATAHELVAGFPAEALMADAELAAVAAADQLAQGSLEEAERYLALAERRSASASIDRRGQAQVLLRVVRLLMARQRGNLPAVAEEARRLQTAAEDPDGGWPGLDEDLRALALINLGTAEAWAARFQEAERHLDQGAALARRIRRPYLEFTGRAHQATIEIIRSTAGAAERSRRAIELAEQHGWTDEPTAGTAYVMLGGALVWQGQPEEAEPWIQRAERTVRAEAEPAEAMAVYYVRGLLELVRGRDADALTAYQAAERLAGRLAATHYLIPPARARLLQVLVRLGDIQHAEQSIADLGERDRDRGDIRVATAVLRLAQDDPEAAAVALAPVLDGSAPVTARSQQNEAFLLEAIARDALGGADAAECALERALDIAEPDGALSIFLLHPAPGLLEQHAGHRTAHASLIAEILGLLAGSRPAPPRGEPRPPLEPLSDSEIRVLRYLPTHLSAPEIASELYLSTNTVKTHVRHLHTKLGTHSRDETVEHARALGLLAPSARHR